MAYQHIDLDYENLQAVIGKVALEGERFILQREGKPVAALVSIEELEILQELEELEDEYDLKAAEEATKESGTVSWEDVRVKYGI
ncbi:MAG: type II toxin-antitoxin system Phd/YefM family antitoxin [Nostocaceae cyanobacterium]|nr:type II toxin-antitoxin system Phd/YefM family antitoxin [Nostocaceae cyanobacterium]